MEYKGYIAEIGIDEEAKILYGDVINTRAVISFRGSSVEELRKSMEETIEEYIDWCKERNKQPESPILKSIYKLG